MVLSKIYKGNTPGNEYNANHVVNTNLNFGAFFMGGQHKLLLQTCGAPSSEKCAKIQSVTTWLALLLVSLFTLFNI